MRLATDVAAGSAHYGRAMSAKRQRVGGVVLALGCAGWVAVAYWPEGAAVGLAPAFGVAVLSASRWPDLAGLIVAVLAVVAAGAGVPDDNSGSMPAFFVVAYALGRRGDRWSPLVAAVLTLAFTVPFGVVVINIVFSAVVFSVTYAAGRMVRRREAAANRAAAAVKELAARESKEVVAQAAAEERSRLSGEALTVVRRAVEAMQRDAAAAEPALDIPALERVQAGGRAAVTDLRQLLGLLRSEPEPAGSRSDSAAVARGIRPEFFEVATLTALVAFEAATSSDADGVASIVLTLALVATVAARRTHVVGVCLAAASVSVLALLLATSFIQGLSTATALALLAWSAAGDGTRSALGALALLAAAAAALSAIHDPDNTAILLITLALSAAAGHRWGAQGREAEHSQAAAAVLRGTQRRAAEHATREERLRLARELHDVASHAVGIMVLQAAAAASLRHRDPDAARAAVREVRQAGAEATAELDALFGVLDEPGLELREPRTQARAVELVPALQALVARLERAGRLVEFAIQDDIIIEQEVASAAIRVVQEALTNSARHAGYARVLVTVTTTEDELRVDVCDDGLGAPAGGAGFGLVGLGERVHALGGRLDAGPSEGRGFAVCAHLPLRQMNEAPA